MKLYTFLFKYANKALAAFALGMAGSLGTAMSDDGVLTGKETVTSLGVGLLTAVGVYGWKRTVQENPLRG